MKKLGTATATSQTVAIKSLGAQAKRLHDESGAHYHVKQRRKPGQPVKYAQLKTSAVYLGGGQIKIAPFPAGFWVIIEQGTKPHLILPQEAKAKGRGARRKNSIARFLRDSGYSTGVLHLSGDRYVTGAVHHPGAGPYAKPWAAAKALVEVIAPRVLVQSQTKAIIDAVR